MFIIQKNDLHFCELKLLSLTKMFSEKNLLVPTLSRITIYDKNINHWHELIKVVAEIFL